MTPRRRSEPLPPDPEHYDAAVRLAERAPAPARVGNVLTGTAGWTDKSLLTPGLFYPRGVSTPEGRLTHYARHFAMVEVDATYYTLLPPEVSTRWVQWTQPSFRFDVKAHPVLTGHPVDVARLPAELVHAVRDAGFEGARIYPDKLPDTIREEITSRFASFLDPLVAADRFGALFLQFPPWFVSNRGNARRVEAVRARFSGLPVAVEFRHRSWLAEHRRDRVLDWLRDLRASYVVVDEPDVARGGVPPVVAVTDSNLAVVRFHGHNAAGWRRGASVSERFNYLYGEDELVRWVDPVRRLAEESAVVHAVFNNCVRNYAVVNAKGLSVLLEEAARPSMPA